MLQNTFLHIKGVGRITERKIWKSGIKTWQGYLKNWKKVDLPEKRSMRILDAVEESRNEFESGNHSYFKDRLPLMEQWRAYKDFEDSTVFLDIETTGLAFQRHDITVIGMYDGSRHSNYVKGMNLDDFQFELPLYKVLVTFNGSMFDVPFIKAKYPSVGFDQIHLDLRFLMRRIGYSGGLKRIENQLGITRRQDVEDLRGIDAVRLWKSYERGNDGALNVLIKYNSEDVQNLTRLMRITYDNLRTRVLQ
jgi:uncharacterized protein YprB with RNaseH-like and TPR domain